MDNLIYTEFNERKTVQAVLFIASHLKRNDFHKIFKILYFSDRDHLANYGRPITGDQYIAMEDGPVPSKLYDIFKSVRGDGYFKDDGRFSQFFSVESWDLIRRNKDPDMRALSLTDIRFLEENIKLYGDMSWEAIREKSHDYAWSNTAPNRTITMDKLITEAGEDESFIEYARQQSYLQKIVR